MAHMEAAAAAAGPRYAPDDPTLPNPWKGLIDGSTGLTYYWNPETNVTQYEKPASAPLPLPSGVSPTDTASQPAPQPASQHGQTAEASQYQQQYMNQLSQQQGQFQVPPTAQVAQQQPSQMPQVSAAGQQGSQMGAFQPQYAHFGQGMPQRGSQIGQATVQQGQMMPQQYGTQMGQQPGQQMLPQGSQMVQQPTQHTSPLLGQQAPQRQGPQVGQPQGHPFMPQHMSYGAYQQPMLPQGQQNAPPYSQHVPQGPSFSYQQENRNGIPQRDDAEFSKIKQTGIPMSPVEQSGRAVGQGPPSINAPNHALQANPLSGSFGSSAHMHQPASSINLPENRNDIVHSQQASTYQNQMNQPMMHPQQHALPPVGSKMGYDDNHQGRASQGYHFNANNEVPPMASPHPKLAVIPMARNPQDKMMGNFPLQTAPSRDTGLDTVGARGMPSMYNHGNVDMPMSNHTQLRPTPMMPGAADVINMSSADAYRQQHEVTATGEDVPPPFMTFEATGFPPEILREVRYLLRWGAYVVRCTAMRTLYMQQVFL